MSERERERIVNRDLSSAIHIKNSQLFNEWNIYVSTCMYCQFQASKLHSHSDQPHNYENNIPFTNVYNGISNSWIKVLKT